MKIIIKLILVLCISNYVSYSQIWESINLNNTIEDFHFFNADIGLALTGANAPNSNKIYKTTNKGVNWFVLKDFENSGYNSANMSFVNANTGYVVVGNGTFDLPTETRIYKTTDAGNTWVRTATIATIQGYYEMFFTSENVGFYTNIFGSTRDLRKTTDGGQTWPVVYQIPSNGNITDIRKSATDPSNTLYISSMHNNKPYLVKYTINSSSEVILADGESDPYDLKTIRKISVVNNNGTDEVKVACYNGIGTYSNSSLFKLSDPPLQIEGLTIHFDFSNSNFGLIGNYLKLMSTTNGGATWTEEFNGNTDVFANYSVIGNVAYAGYTGSNGLGILTRKIAGNYNTNFDWQGGTNWSIAIDGENVPTSSTGYFRGGTVALYANQFQINGSDDTTARFYYWGGNCNASMNYSSNSYLINSGSNINADYKTLLKSTTAGALSNANQVKALKDTNGVNNLIYESMGGIFFTRTLHPYHNTFKAEEVLSSTAYYPHQGYATFNNKNPYLSENKNTNNTETNMWACWERREGDNIKIIASARHYDDFNPPEPNLPKHYWRTAELLTLSGVPDGFECMPKIFVAGGSAQPLRVLTYLKPDGANKKIVGKVYTTTGIEQEYDITVPGNIVEYAVAPIYPYYGITFQLHIAYRNNQTVYYKSVNIGQYNDWYGIQPIYQVINQDVNISSDNSGWRAALDIALKNTANSSSSFNMQPVVTYQGRKNVRIIIERDGQPSEIITNNYPIYIKERLPSGDWSSVIVSYNNPIINEPQMNPTIIGSKHKNSCIVSYGKGYSAPYTFMQKVHLWNGSISSGYNCNPISYTANDVKIVKDGLIDDGVPSLSQKMMTLSYQSANLYNVGHQALNITYGIGGDDGFEEISGLIEANYVQYTFNLGNILVNNQNINFANNLDTVIDNIGELNNNLASKTFLLNENDTLIIGRNASYVLTDPNAAPAEIEYWVKLMNKSTSSLHRLLAHDTLHTADSVLYEYLEGYIIRDIPNGSDSFYVQLEIDTVDGNYGVGGGIGGDDDGGDNNQIKRKIFWENEKITHETSNIPKSFNLYQNFPNPFNPATVIKYDLPKDVKVTVKIYDLLGREVTTLVNNEFKNAGRYELNWNAGNYASGVYIYRIEAGDYISTKKMVLLK